MKSFAQFLESYVTAGAMKPGMVVMNPKTNKPRLVKGVHQHQTDKDAVEVGYQYGRMIYHKKNEKFKLVERK